MVGEGRPSTSLLPSVAAFDQVYRHFRAEAPQDVDARDKPEHDEKRGTRRCYFAGAFFGVCQSLAPPSMPASLDSIRALAGSLKVTYFELPPPIWTRSKLSRVLNW